MAILAATLLRPSVEIEAHPAGWTEVPGHVAWFEPLTLVYT